MLRVRGGSSLKRFFTQSRASGLEAHCADAIDAYVRKAPRTDRWGWRRTTERRGGGAWAVPGQEKEDRKRSQPGLARLGPAGPRQKLVPQGEVLLLAPTTQGPARLPRVETQKSRRKLRTTGAKTDDRDLRPDLVHQGVHWRERRGEETEGERRLSGVESEWIRQTNEGIGVLRGWEPKRSRPRTRKAPPIDRELTVI